MTEANQLAASEGRTYPAITYGLYLLGLVLTPLPGHIGVSLIVAVVIAYAGRVRVGPVTRSHFNWLIRTFWLSMLWALAGGAVVAISAAFPHALGAIVVVGVAILGLAWIWTLIRLLAGAAYLARRAAYPRPRSWLI